MKVPAFNGSPRRNGTTATLLEQVLAGAASQGAETEFIQLGQLNMKGCQSCYSCKKRGGKSYGKCALKDDMTLLYEKIEQADAFVLGSPIYFGYVTSEAKMFIDRMFPYLNFGSYSSNFPKKIPVGLIYTMGADDERGDMFKRPLQFNEMAFSMLFGPTETLFSMNTMHVEDYSKIVADAVAPMLDRKLKHKKEVFPQDCEKAFEMGSRFATATE